MTGPLAFTVAGEPASQGSKKVMRGRLIEASRKTKPWRAKVTAAAKEARQMTASPTFTGPVRIRVKFVFARPKHHYRTGRFSGLLRPNAPYWKTSTPDTDKALRAVCDALADADVYGNDAQVCDVRAVKVWAAPSSPYPAYCSIEISEAPAP